LNGAHQVLIYADDVNLVGKNVHTIKRNNKTVRDASKEVGVEVNIQKTKHVHMSLPECWTVTIQTV